MTSTATPDVSLEDTADVEQQQQQQVPLCSTSTISVGRNERTSLIKSLCHRCHEHSGIWYMILANFIFSCCIFALKLVPADMFDIMTVRFAVQTAAFGSFAGLYKHYSLFDTNGQPLACALNVFMSSATNFFYFAAYYFLPLSDLNTIKYTYIVWAAILAVVFLKDRFKVVNAVALLLTFVGLILATKPDFLFKTFDLLFSQSANSNATSSFQSTANATSSSTRMTAGTPYHYLGIALASLSALTKAIQMIARKQLVITKQPYSVMNFQFTVLGLFVSLIYGVVRRFWLPAAYEWKWMMIAGLIFGAFQLITNTFYAKALKRENLQLLSILGSLDIVYAVVLQYIFFQKTKPWIFYIGALFIVMSAVILSVDRHFSNEREKKKKPTMPSPTCLKSNTV